MRRWFPEIWLLGCLISVASGCAASRQHAVAVPVGPAPSATASHATEGALVVYSALDIGTPGDPTYIRFHSDYKLYPASAESPKPLRAVRNRAAGTRSEPEVVRLAPGRYRVVARSSTFGAVTVPVMIAAGKTTRVHLDGSEITGRASGSANEFVSLPDGLIIGWRAEDDGQEK